MVIFWKQNHTTKRWSLTIWAACQADGINWSRLNSNTPPLSLLIHSVRCSLSLSIWNPLFPLRKHVGRRRGGGGEKKTKRRRNAPVGEDKREKVGRVEEKERGRSDGRKWGRKESLKCAIWGYLANKQTYESNLIIKGELQARHRGAWTRTR